MTILTNSSGEKKGDKGGLLPLFDPQQQQPAEVDNGIQQLIRRRHSFRVAMLLFLVGISVLSFGIIGGSILARHFVKPPLDRLRFHGYCNFPYAKDDAQNQALLDMNMRFRDEALQQEQLFNTMLADIFSLFGASNDPRLRKDFGENMVMQSTNATTDSKFFTQEVDVEMDDDTDDEGVVKIDVPEFKNSQSGRFMHDFKFNQTAIMEKNRCFIMPLDRETTLPPKDFIDLINRTLRGDFNLNMDVVRKNMRVVMPAIADRSAISPNIAEECKHAKMYRLEEIVHGVYKRSVDEKDQNKFAHFSGRLVTMNIQNIRDVDAAENDQK